MQKTTHEKVSALNVQPGDTVWLRGKKLGTVESVDTVGKTTALMISGSNKEVIVRNEAQLVRIEENR